MKTITEKLYCDHCGDVCFPKHIAIDEKNFCCDGCKTVYCLLTDSGLGSYYSFEKTPGINGREGIRENKFAYLDDEDIAKKFVVYSDPTKTRIILRVPQIHCSSCLYLLENIFKINSAITSSKVNFIKKEVSIDFSTENTSLREVVETFAKIGYEPDLKLNQLDEKVTSSFQKTLYMKLGVAGFCFGNVMMNSFPEYFGEVSEILVKETFSYLNLILALPVLFYSATEFFKSAYYSLKSKHLNIDVPIALGMFVLFVRSTYEILSGTGLGYMDSFVGFVFFLLLGRVFQQKTYDNLSFNRDYKSYFPIAVTQIKEDEEIEVPIEKITVGSNLLIRNEELLPCDGVLSSPSVQIDYSFVTGEAEPVTVESGETLYAGGKVIGKSVIYNVTKPVNQSYLTRLWNDFEEDEKGFHLNLSDRTASYFTYAVLLIGLGSFIYWLPFGVGKAVNVLSSVLIVACPCALALSAPFTFGSVLNVFSKNGLYLKSTAIIEKLASISTIIFDKTGTLTHGTSSTVEYYGENLKKDTISKIKRVCAESNHPISRKIYQFYSENVSGNSLTEFMETPGFGITATLDNTTIVIGSKTWLEKNNINIEEEYSGSGSYIGINGLFVGYYAITQTYRIGFQEMLNSLQNFKLGLLSGDDEYEKNTLKKFFPKNSLLKFRQSPEDKLNYVQQLKDTDESVLMIGDGLNDAGALKKSNVGFSVTDEVNTFVPACHGILKGQKLRFLNRFIRFSNVSINIVIVGYIISITYNVIGLTFAVQGLLSPILSAILMPLSSITIIAFTTLTTYIYARKHGFK